MISSEAAPSLVPKCETAVYLVLDDFGAQGRAYRMTDETDATLEKVVENLLQGEYRAPVRVIAFNTSEAWCFDVSEDIAWELLKRVASEGRSLPTSTRSFCEFHVGERETALAESGLV